MIGSQSDLNRFVFDDVEMEIRFFEDLEQSIFVKRMRSMVADF